MRSKLRKFIAIRIFTPIRSFFMKSPFRVGDKIRYYKVHPEHGDIEGYVTKITPLRIIMTDGLERTVDISIAASWKFKKCYKNIWKGKIK